MGNNYTACGSGGGSSAGARVCAGLVYTHPHYLCVYKTLDQLTGAERERERERDARAAHTLDSL